MSDKTYIKAIQKRKKEVQKNVRRIRKLKEGGRCLLCKKYNRPHTCQFSCPAAFRNDGYCGTYVVKVEEIEKLLEKLFLSLGEKEIDLELEYIFKKYRKCDDK